VTGDDDAPSVIGGISLTDAGADGWRMVECVDPAGRRSFWLMDPDGEGGRTVDLPAHEYTGRLPSWILRRAQDRSIRCGRIAPTTGKSCRQRVNAPDKACRFHREVQP